MGQSVAGYHCSVPGATMCTRSLTQTAVSVTCCEAEFHAASACARELLGLAELFKKLHYQVSVRLEMDSDSARHILQRRGPGRLKHIDIRCMAFATVDQRKTPVGWTREYEKQYSRPLHEVFGWTTNAVALEESWTTRSWRHGRLRACEQRFQSSRV